MTESIDRNQAISRIRTALRRRSKKAWSVTGGRGTAWCWIEISSPPARRVDGHMSDEDRAELGRLLSYDEPVHSQGISIPASHDYRQEYIDRSEGRAPSVTGKPYWD